jgi:hypothetical protein
VDFDNLQGALAPTGIGEFNDISSLGVPKNRTLDWNGAGRSVTGLWRRCLNGPYVLAESTEVAKRKETPRFAPGDGRNHNRAKESFSLRIAL